MGDGQHGAGGEEHSSALQQFQASQEQPQGIPLSLHSWLTLCSVLAGVKILYYNMVKISVADPDPGSGAFLTLGSQDPGPGWVRNQDPDAGSGSGMNIPDHDSESLETIFGLKIL